MFISYGNTGGIRSDIDAYEAERIMNKCISLIDDLNSKLKNFSNDVNEITLNWNGGGKTQDSSLYSSITAANEMYDGMVAAINYAKSLVLTVKDAGNQLYRGYNITEDLFPEIQE